KPHKGTHLTKSEMDKIEGYKAENRSNRAIARLHGHSHQTNNNAIKKGSFTQKRKQIQNGKTYTYYEEVYSASLHEDVYLENRSNCGRRTKWVEADEFIDWADKRMLNDKWSPDIVIAKAKEKFPLDVIPSTSSLYNWIESGIMRTKNIDLLDKVGRKSSEIKGYERSNITIFDNTLE